MSTLDNKGLSRLWNRIKLLIANKCDCLVESVSLCRRNILFTETTRGFTGVTAPTNADYSYMNGACTDGTHIVVAYSDGIYSTTDKIKLVKYDSNFNAIAEALIDNDHANGMCYYNGHIYATSRDRTITVVDFATLTFVKSIQMSHDVTWIDFYDGNFYTGTNHNIVIYDSTLNGQIKKITTNYSEYVRGSVYLNGGAIINGYIYFVVGNNSIIKVNLSGEVVRVYNIGATNGDYVVGEGEFLLKYNNELILGSSQFVSPGTDQNWRVQQFFNLDFNVGYNGSNTQKRAWEGGGTIYVNNTVTTSTTADGSSSKPYPVISWAITEHNAQRMNRPGYKGMIHVTKSTYNENVCLYDTHNLELDGNSSTINGITSVGSGGIYVYEFNVAYRDVSYSGNYIIYLRNTTGTFNSITKLADTSDVQGLAIVNSVIIIHLVLQDEANKGQLGYIVRSNVSSRINISNATGNYVMTDKSVCENYYTSVLTKSDNNGYVSNALLWEGELYEGTIPVNVYNGSQFVANRYKGYTFITSDIVQKSHVMRGVTSTTFTISDVIIHNGKSYTRQVTFNRSTGAVTNNIVIDNTTGTQYAYNGDSSYPFFKMTRILGND